MYRNHGTRVRWLAVVAAATVGSSVAVAAPAHAADNTAAAGTLAARITALAASKANWRVELAGSLSWLQGARTVTGTVSGAVAAETVTLPASIELTGETTIIAREIVVATGAVLVNSHGYGLRLYPVALLRSDPKAGKTGDPDGATIAATTIDTSGQTGLLGAFGVFGESALQGADGQNGAHGYDLDHCDGQPGGPGENGGFGGPGGVGGPGGPGGNAGPITLDIPPGDTETYHLIARGGNGGPGGIGGWGGSGGSGGFGGWGGDSYPDCWNDGWAGRGGDGGSGGWGGRGGNGGQGGVGGRGGDVTVVNPGVLGRDQVTIDNQGGAPGAGGFPGGGGGRGWGAAGGLGGWSWAQGRYEVSGFAGPPGGVGQPGSTGPPGAPGANGAVSVPPCMSEPVPPEPGLDPPSPGGSDTEEFIDFDYDCTVAVAAGPVTAAILPGIRCSKTKTKPSKTGTSVTADTFMSCRFRGTTVPAPMRLLAMGSSMWRRPLTIPIEPWRMVGAPIFARRIIATSVGVIAATPCPGNSTFNDYIMTSAYYAVPPPGYRPRSKFGQIITDVTFAIAC